MIEYIISNGRDRVGYRQRGKTLARIERFIADDCNSVRYRIGD